MTESERNEETIFNRARRIPDAGARAIYLGEACAGDDALLHRVEALLAVNNGPHFLLDRSAAVVGGDGAIASVIGEDRIGTEIGPYKCSVMDGFGVGTCC